MMAQSPWEMEPMVAIHQRLTGEMLGEEDGVALIDEDGAHEGFDDGLEDGG